ncbi:hypothetical protein Bca4012_102665 [Brassica carinata]
MIGRADIEGSKATPLMNAWLPQASYPCGNFSDTSSFKFRRSKGSIGHAFTVRIRTENQNQTSFYPVVPHEISVLVELILGHLRYLLTDVPPQPNSPPDNVLRSIDSRRVLGLKEGVVTPPPIHGVIGFPCPHFSSELAVRRPGKLPKSRSQSAPADTRRSARHVSAQAARQQSTGSNWDPEPSPQSQSFSGYGSILPTSLPTLFHRPEAVHLGDLMRYEYDRRERTRSSGFSRAGMHRHHATRRCSSSRWTLPPLSRFRDRLTHVQVPLTWNLSSSPSKFSFEYLLLPPRSAPTSARRLALLGFAATAAPPTHRGLALAPTAGIGRALQRHPFSG